MTTNEISMGDLRKNLGTAVDRVHHAHKTIYIYNNGKPYAAIRPLTNRERENLVQKLRKKKFGPK